MMESNDVRRSESETDERRNMFELVTKGLIADDV